MTGPIPPVSVLPRTTMAGRFRVRFVAVLTVVYVAFVLAVTLYPHTIDGGIDPYLQKMLDYLYRHGVPTFVDYNFVEFTANIGFFVPVGFLLGLLVTLRFWWTAVLIAAAFSAAIETTQKLFLPGRVADIGDVIANSTGGLIGCIVAVLVRMVILHRDTLVIADVRAGRRGVDGTPVRGRRIR